MKEAKIWESKYRWLQRQHVKKAAKIRKFAKKIVDALDGEICTQEDESNYFELCKNLNYFIARQQDLAEKDKRMIENFWD